MNWKDPQDAVLRQIRQQWLDFLEAIPYFADVSIFPEDKAEITNEAQRALGPGQVKAGRTGVLIVLMTVTAKVVNTGESGPVFNEIMMMARCYENPDVNRAPSGNGTGKTYEALAEAVAGYTHGQCYPPSASGVMTLEDPGIVLGNDPDYPCKDVYFIVPGSLARPLPQLPAPIVTENAGMVTMVCATPGAAIFWTTDNTKPTPFNTLYLAPINVAPGQNLKARAWLAGCLTSPVTQLLIT